MNLDLLPLGWVHFVASLVAVGVGALILVRPKGTPVHKLRGRVCAAAILVTSVTALGIYRSGHFFFAHWLGVAALLSITAGVAAARFKIPQTGWMHVHLTCMLASFYLLIGGGVNEVFLRVDALRRLAPTFDSALIGMTHLAVIVFFAGLIAYFYSSARARMSGRTALRRQALPGAKQG
jgi:uncharacterized membrane protein